MRCERMHAVISVANCLNNQKKRMRGLSSRTNEPFYPSCSGCEQGELARSSRLSDDDVERIITEMRGDEIMKTATLEAKDTKQCSGCGKIPPVSSFWKDSRGRNGLKSKCKDCLNMLSKERRHAKHDIGSSSGGVSIGPEAATVGSRIVMVDLTDFEGLYQEIEKVAMAEDRTPELQVRHWLRVHFAALAGGAQ